MYLLQFHHDREFPFSLAEFFESVPPYAILSHTWSPDELTFMDIRRGTGKNKAGYSKVLFCGQQGVRDGLQYFWVDSCCVDRSNSSELSATIISTFRWCREAAICYVYLSDITFESWERSFPFSRWFTRSWTLQELIAPRVVKFFSIDGYFLGDKLSLAPTIHSITGIQVRALQGDPLSSFSVAERMLWAKGRTARRPEDRAYSLLGIFDISMPILYGEGSDRAFQRLQDEIAKNISISRRTTSYGMRLLLTSSDPLRMETVPINNSLQYAILSHTWGDDEVLFEDVRIGTTAQRRGYSKIRKCCDLAFQHGFDYVWVDTCCIDKSSSSELQEAICSMYKWYERASICYVYLEDCRYNDDVSLNKSRWFTRGWTLRKLIRDLKLVHFRKCLIRVEELIAPSFVEFYDQNWNEIGTKQSLCDQIAKATSIDPIILRGANPTDRTIAERMSWAASRSTTRPEDAAYCLMGLFNVFMPMLYGEGGRAFIRLQEEIMKQTEDFTIFSWNSTVPHVSYRGIFAHSPAEFASIGPGKIVPRFSHSSHLPDYYPPPVLSSRGLVLTLPLLSCSPTDEIYLAWVCCLDQTDDGPIEKTPLCVRFQKIQDTPPIYARSNPEQLEACSLEYLNRFYQRTICVLPSTILEMSVSHDQRRGEIVFHPLTIDKKSIAPKQIAVADSAWWRDKDNLLTYQREQGWYQLAAIRFEIEGGFMVIIGFREDKPWCSIVTDQDAAERGSTLEDLFSSWISAKPSAEYTDRAKKILTNNRVLSAAVRNASFANPETPRFAFYLTLS